MRIVYHCSYYYAPISNWAICRENILLRIKILHQFVNLLPSVIRRRLIPYLIGRVIAPLFVCGRNVRPGSITVVGFLSSTVGLGQGARLALYAFKRLGYDVSYVDIGNIFCWHNNISVEMGRPAKVNEGGVAIFHINPPELSVIIPLLGRGLIRNKKIIGYWAWELESIPRNWYVGFRLVDEIWVPSRFVAKALKKCTDVPVRVVHHPLIRLEPSSLGRHDFRLDESTFLVLTMFDMRSSAERKNPLGAIQAFRLAFGDRDDVMLVVKAGNVSEAPDILSRIENEIGDSKNIRLMFDKLSQEDHAALISCADVIISLHRSEGFGLVLAEAMMMGKPVIATAYSGNMDFMDSESAILISYKLVPINDPQGVYGGKYHYWSEPDIDEAAEWLVRLAEDYDLRRSLGARARKSAERIFDDKLFHDAVRKYINVQ